MMMIAQEKNVLVCDWLINVENFQSCAGGERGKWSQMGRIREKSGNEMKMNVFYARENISECNNKLKK